jgi:signal transduction histidine kinase
MNIKHLAAAIAMLAALPAFAQDSKQEAIALVDKAVANIQKKSIEDACKDFADPKGGYIQGEMYVFVYEANGFMKCHATNPKLNNKDMNQLRDANGKYFSKEMRDLAMSGKTGWVDYVWVNPVNKQLEPKSSYVKKVNDSYFVGVGIYTKK